MARSTPKMPQRKPHKAMSGEEILNKLAGNPQSTILSPLAIKAPKYTKVSQPKLEDIYKQVPKK